MKQKRDENGKFVKMYPSREEYESKIAKLEKEIDMLATKGQESKRGLHNVRRQDFGM